MKPPLRWALLGASNIAESRVIPSLRNRGDVPAVVFSADEKRGAAFATRNGIERSAVTIDDALTSDIDAVYVSTKNDLHHAQAIRALRAGKHVLCEKPLALKIADAEEMIAVAKEEGLVLAINHHLPGSPLHVAARKLVAEGKIGRTLSARVRHAVSLRSHLQGWRIQGSEPGSGVLMDLTSHDASVLGPLLGKAVKVTALGASQAGWNDSGSIDAAMTVIEYVGPNGEQILAQTHDAYTVAFDHTALEIQGTLGSITILDAMTQDSPGTVTLTTSNGDAAIDVDTSNDLYSIVLDAFAAAIAGDGVPTATGQDGLEALKVALAAEESIRSSRSVSVLDAR